MSSITMEGVQTDKARLCIELINLLRSAGLEKDVELPTVAVIGDKNSGKSSVLERLSGVSLPRGRYYPLILQMNRTKDDWTGVVKCDRPSKEIRISPLNRKDVPDLMRESRYYNTVHLEISSPDVPDLTLIDLPSIPPSADKGYTKIKAEIIEVITNSECLILMVVPCNVDITSTEAFRLAQEVDPDGERTLGLLTKPDIVSQDQGKTIVDTVQNKVINLKKGFMIVRCYNQTKKSLMDPNEKEVKFFKEHALFKSLYDEGHATCPKLGERLSQELAQHIEKCLPQLKGYIKKELLQTNATIDSLERPPPSDGADKLPFLTDILNTFIQDVTRLTSGELLDLTDQRVFSVWRKTVVDSEESFQCKLDAKVARYEQSGFSDLQTFDQMIKDQITLLEKRAVITLSNTADIIKEELLKLMESDFIGFSSLISEAKSAISDVIQSNQKAAESLLRTLFKVEQFEVQAEGRMYSTKKREKKKGTTAHYYSYYQTVCQRLTSQIQMVIRFHLIKELPTELEKKMQQILDETQYLNHYLNYDDKLKTLRDTVQKCFMALTQAQILLSEM